MANGVPHIVATGVHSWVEIVPDFDTTFENIDTLLAAGRKSKALGLMNTVWTDSAQNLLRQSWPGIAYGAIAPWQSTPMDRGRFFADYAGQMYPAVVAPDIAQALASLARSEVALQKVLGQSTMRAMWNDPFAPALLKKAREHRGDLHQTRLLAEEAQEHLYRAIAAGGHLPTLDSLLVGGRILDYAGMKQLYAVEIADAWERQPQPPERPKSLHEFLGPGIYDENHSRINDLMDGITELSRVYRANWLAEHTPYRLGTALGRWDAEYEYWRQLQVRIKSLERQFKPGQPLPPLAQ